MRCPGAPNDVSYRSRTGFHSRPYAHFACLPTHLSPHPPATCHFAHQPQYLCRTLKPMRCWFCQRPARFYGSPSVETYIPVHFLTAPASAKVPSPHSWFDSSHSFSNRTIRLPVQDSKPYTPPSPQPINLHSSVQDSNAHKSCASFPPPNFTSF